MAGFYIPKSYGNINLQGYHFHFLTKDKSSGGHVLDLLSEKIILEIDNCENIELIDLK